MCIYFLMLKSRDRKGDTRTIFPPAQYFRNHITLIFGSRSLLHDCALTHKSCRRNTIKIKMVQNGLKSRYPFNILLSTPCVALGWGSLKIYNKSGGIQCTFLQLLVDRYISDFLCSVLWTILFPNSFMIINIRNCCRHMSVPAAGDWLDEVILCLRGDQETRRPPV